MKIVVLGLMLAFSIPAQAQNIMVLGVGNASCGSWLQSRRSNNYFSEANWVVGFLSAAGVYGDYGNILANTDSNGVLYWVDNYCRSNPTKPIIEASKAFVRAHRTQ
jgi:hypothetical protein